MECTEPSDDGLLSDPIMLALLESDGLEAAGARALTLGGRDADE
jgi:hypothetical protein